MIYTIGKIDLYEELLKNYKNAQKSQDGSVWKTYLDAKKYCDGVNRMAISLNKQDLFSVYGVDADWDIDTEIIDEDLSYHRLKRDAKLIKIHSLMTPFVVKTPLE